MKPQCEIVSGQVLPTIRAMVVKDLVKRYEFSQVEVARKLGITQPAVSQYLSALRGKSHLEKKLMKLIGQDIRSLADDVASGKLTQPDLVRRYCAICSLMKKKGLF
ncbi:MAG: transcriptional regulator [Candidatus Hadarchaeum sp.]|uniref:transcriptional regulator n=1 Tax=Candidatus Hadarchaeum sp. TaxID=2883567 RepID=UPI003D134E80